MKLEPVTKLDKKNTSASKKIDDGVVSANYDAIVFFSNLQSICSHPEAAWSMKLTFSLIVTFFLQNLKTKLKNI